MVLGQILTGLAIAFTVNDVGIPLFQRHVSRKAAAGFLDQVLKSPHPDVGWRKARLFALIGLGEAFRSGMRLRAR